MCIYKLNSKQQPSLQLCLRFCKKYIYMFNSFLLVLGIFNLCFYSFYQHLTKIYKVTFLDNTNLLLLSSQCFIDAVCIMQYIKRSYIALYFSIVIIFYNSLNSLQLAALFLKDAYYFSISFQLVAVNISKHRFKMRLYTLNTRSNLGLSRLRGYTNQYIFTKLCLDQPNTLFQLVY